ncbi:hypothetical protein [Lichenicoccus sp.]|uniref:hypothetical protein n=1 Tax=Lichenicoccus sp. TaxID=2781899 RepID=UPI003D0E0496
MTRDVASAAAHARKIGCRTPSCRAIIVIHELLLIERFEEGDANGVNSLYTGDRPRIAGRRLDRVLLDHPELYGPVCATGVRLVSHFHYQTDMEGFVVPIQLLVQGVDMDLRNHGHCVRDLLDALPRDPANDQIRVDARDLCLGDDENHHRPQAACDALARSFGPPNSAQTVRRSNSVRR